MHGFGLDAQQQGVKAGHHQALNVMRIAVRQGLLDGTIDALVSDHTPVDEDAKALPFAQSEPGATGLELLLSLALKWAQDDQVPMQRALAVITASPSAVLGDALGANAAHVGCLVQGAPADVCVLNPQTHWVVEPAALRSQGRHTPFSGYELPAQVVATLVGGRVAYAKNE